MDAHAMDFNPDKLGKKLNSVVLNYLKFYLSLKYTLLTSRYQRTNSEIYFTRFV